MSFLSVVWFLRITTYLLLSRALDYALEKATPFIQKTGSEMLDQLSATVRPNRRNKTDRKDLHGGGGGGGQFKLMKFHMMIY